MPLPARTVAIILSNEHLTARQLAAALGLPPRTVEGVRRRWCESPRGRPPRVRLAALAELRRGPLAPAPGVAQQVGCSLAAVRRARRVLLQEWR